MMTIKQFWNKVNCWGTKPIRKYKVWDCEETPAMKMKSTPMQEYGEWDRNTATSYTSAGKMDTNPKEMENPMQECPDSDAAVGNAGGGSSYAKREDSLSHPSPGSVRSEWFCASCHEEWIPEDRIVADSGCQHTRVVCYHCGCPLSQVVTGYWIFNSDGSKTFFQETT